MMGHDMFCHSDEKFFVVVFYNNGHVEIYEQPKDASGPPTIDNGVAYLVSAGNVLAALGKAVEQIVRGWMEVV